MKINLAILSAALACATSSVFAWDYEGHRAINVLALAALPKDFPAFALTPAARERIAFLAGEPDRWRNTPDTELQHVNGPNHYLDLEQLADYGLTPESLPPLRYDFAAMLARARAAHPEKFAPIDAEKDKDHTRELVGFLPWQIAEDCAKLKSEFSYLKTFQAHGGTPEEIANAEANIVYTMGVMGHYVGDSSQPLHTTKHHHGWVGDNPHGYPTNSTFHAWIDGGYFRRLGGLNVSALTSQIHPAQHIGEPGEVNGVFRATVAFIAAQNKQVEPLYQIEKEHRLSGHGDVDPIGKNFLEHQIVLGAQRMGDIWFTAWQDATEDKHLKTELEKRQQPRTDSGR